MNEVGGSEALIQKWGRVLEGVDDPYVRKVTATLLENQAKAVIAERAKLEEVAVGDGTTTVGRLGTFQKFAFPLVRRVYPELIANKVVGVQPMSGPVSQIFYLGHTRAFGSTLQNIYSKYNLTYRGLATSAIGTSDSSGQGTFGQEPGAGTGGLDENDGATYDSFDSSAVIRADAVGGGGVVSSTYGGKIASWPDDKTILGWSVSAGERLTGTGIPEIAFQIQQQPVVARTRKMRALWTLEASQDLKAYHNLDLERELTELLSKELTLEIDRELLEDLRMLAYNPSTGAFGGWNPASLDNPNSNQFGDIGGLGPNETQTFAPSAFLFDFNEDAGASPVNNPGSNIFVVDLTASAINSDFAPQHLGHRYSNLLAMIHFASNDVYRTTHRGPGTVLVTSPLFATFLESAAKLEGGLPREMGPTNMDGKQITYAGKFAGKFDLFIDPLWPQDECLVAYKGSGPMDAGFVYAPYIPLQQLPTITDPESFQPRKGILTRYGKAGIEPSSRFYRVVRVVAGDTNALFDPFGLQGTRSGTSTTAY